MFEPWNYSLKFRPNSDWREYQVTEWPVVGGSDFYKCGEVEVRIDFSDERFIGTWLNYNSRDGYMSIDPEDETAPGLTVKGKEQKIPFLYEAVYIFRGKETVVHSE